MFMKQTVIDLWAEIDDHLHSLRTEKVMVKIGG